MADLDSLRLQLSEVHSRAKLHADRLWQLPFAFLGVVGLSTSLFDRQADSSAIFWLFVLYATFGLFVTGAMFGALEGVRRSLRHMIRIEQELSLETTTKVQYVWHFLPYFAMHLLVLCFAIVMAITHE